MIKNMLVLKPALAACVALGLTASGWANTVSFDFLTPSGDVGSSSYTYGTGPNTLTAVGSELELVVIRNPQHLFGKNSGLNETGLGLLRPIQDNELDLWSLIQLDFSALKSQGFNHFEITLGSLQQGQGYKFLWRDTVGGFGDPAGFAFDTWTAPDNSTLSKTIDVTSSVMAHSVVGVQGWPFSDVNGLFFGTTVIESVTATSPDVPDGGSTFALLGMSLVGVTAAGRKFARPRRAYWLATEPPSLSRLKMSAPAAKRVRERASPG